MDPEFSPADVVVYQRAATTNHEVLRLLGEVSEQRATAGLHRQAVELSRSLDEVLGTLLAAPIETDIGPLVT
ncbi:MAG: hypothetical protein ACR2IK_15975 [Chloroflexota bacterium]